MGVLGGICIPLSVCAFLYGIFGLVDGAIHGRFYSEALAGVIVGAVLAALAALFLRLSRKRAEREKKRAPISGSEDFLRRLERRVKNGRRVLFAMIAVGCVLLLGAGGAVLGVRLDNAVLKLISSVALGFHSCVALFVLFAIYVTSYRPLKKNQKLLERLGVTVEYCLEGVGRGATPVIGHVIVAERALVLEKTLLVIPYASIGWIFKRVQQVHGVPVSSTCVIYTIYGDCMEFALTDAEFRSVFEACGHNIPEDVVFGFGKQQRKAYAALKKAYKE